MRQQLEAGELKYTRTIPMQRLGQRRGMPMCLGLRAEDTRLGPYAEG